MAATGSANATRIQIVRYASSGGPQALAATGSADATRIQAATGSANATRIQIVRYASSGGPQALAATGSADAARNALHKSHAHRRLPVDFEREQVAGARGNGRTE